MTKPQTQPEAQEAPAPLQKARMVTCAACRRPVLDIDEERIGVTARVPTPLGHTTQHINFHRTCAEGVFEVLRQKLSIEQEKKQ